MSDYDKAQWQAEQEAQDAVQTAYRDKMAKARERSARNAKRKIARLHTKLTELGHISDFEDEFGESVLERLEKFGSAFHDLEKGRAGDALSAAQKQVVARMNKKVKELKSKQYDMAESIDPDVEYERTTPAWKKSSKSSFKSKSGFGKNNGYTPRVRHIEDDMVEDVKGDEDTNRSDIDFSDPKIEPFIPLYKAQPRPAAKISSGPKESDVSNKTLAKRPFLRLVSHTPPEAS